MGSEVQLSTLDRLTLSLMKKKGAGEMFDILIRASNSSTKNHIGTKSLEIAAITGSSEVLDVIIASGVHYNHKDRLGFTPLAHAAKCGNVAVVNILLQQPSIDVNICTGDGFSPLMLAVHFGHIHVVKALLRTAEDPAAASTLLARQLLLQPTTDLVKKLVVVNIQANDGATVLILAAQNGDMACVEALLAAGSSLNLSRHDGTSALCVACQDGHLSIVKALLAYNANTNLSCNDGATALILAIGGGHERVVNALLDAGADVNAKTVIGSTALMFAAQRGHAAITKVLIAAGAELDVESDSHGTALKLAANGNHLEVVKELLLAGASVYLGGTSGDDGIKHTIMNGQCTSSTTTTTTSNNRYNGTDDCSDELTRLVLSFQQQHNTKEGVNDNSFSDSLLFAEKKSSSNVNDGGHYSAVQSASSNRSELSLSSTASGDEGSCVVCLAACADAGLVPCHEGVSHRSCKGCARVLQRIGLSCPLCTHSSFSIKAFH